MGQAGKNLLFALKAANDVARVQAAPDDFERDFAMQLLIFREINVAIPPLPMCERIL